VDRDGASDHRGPPVFILIFLLGIVVMIVNYDRKMFAIYATGLYRKFKDGGAK
jgi:hypothetical protein